MKEDEANKQQQQEESSFLVRKQQEKKRKQGGTLASPIGTQLMKAIAYERIPTLFDTKVEEERDKNIIKDLKKLDEDGTLERKGKPVVFSVEEHRVVLALGYVLGRYRETEAVQRIIADPTTNEEISININLRELSHFLYGTGRKTKIDELRKIIEKLGNTYQIFPLNYKNDKGETVKQTLYSKVLKTGDILETVELNPDSTPKEGTKNVFIKVQYGKIFFIRLNKRYAMITPRFFEVWRKSRKGELFPILLNSALSAYGACRKAAQDEETRLRKENEKRTEGKLSEKELQEEIDKAQEKAYKYEILYENIKKRVRTNYEGKLIDKATGKRENEKQFNYRLQKDVESVLEDFKEIGFITDKSNPYVKSEDNPKEHKAELYFKKDYYKLEHELPPVKATDLLPPSEES